jgi:hypothetical protein
MTLFRHTLGTAKFHGNLLREGLQEGFVEIFAQQSETGAVFDVDEDNMPSELAESSIEVTTCNASSSVPITLSFYDT